MPVSEGSHACLRTAQVVPPPLLIEHEEGPGEGEARALDTKGGPRSPTRPSEDGSRATHLGPVSEGGERGQGEASTETPCRNPE